MPLQGKDMIWRRSRFAGALSLLFILTVQTVMLAQVGQEPLPLPETGYISDSRYVNAYFGFSLPVPQDAEFRDFVLPATGNSHSIFGLQAQRKGLTALTVSATESSGNPTDDARKAAAGVKRTSVKKIEIGGKEFWKSESDDDSRAGTMHMLIYAIAMSGYTLQFTVVSFDRKLANELRHSIESITFIDPTQARVLAGSNARCFRQKLKVMPRLQHPPPILGNWNLVWCPAIRIRTTR